MLRSLVFVFVLLLRLSDVIQRHFSARVFPPFVRHCNCRSYRCPHLGNDGNYPKWNPPVVSSGACTPKDMETLEHEPFPPDFKVLFFGNSHIRQASVTTAILVPLAWPANTRYMRMSVHLVNARCGVPLLP